ncbi:ABC transporter permease [Granulicella sp. dw_53]|uniref:ABC transporter permease n=1 Tax=Granulicella sp. dw_53 TaxID=2719792 RepID=UPI001BD52965|nr:ABC transporter permease [Granulicella sp. dw_53]
MAIKTSWIISLKALRRNKLQTALTMIGMTIGVATVLTMIALGSGAQAAIQDQVKAAGMNLIIVKAGNYQLQQERAPDDAIENAKVEPELGFGSGVYVPGNALLRRSLFHPEDDPFAVHDHPTSRQRLGDSEAGLGAAATLTIPDADAIRKINGVQYVSEGIHENAHVGYQGQRWFTRMHGDDVSMPKIKRAWVFTHGDYFTKRQEANADQVVVLGNIVAEKLFGKDNPVGKTVTLWNQSFKVTGVISSSNWMVAPAAGDDEFDAIYVPVTTVQKLLNLTKLNDITITTLSTGDVTRVSKDITDLLRGRHKIAFRTPDDFQVTSQARKALTGGGMRADMQRSVVGNVAGLEKVTLEQLGKTLDRASATMTALLASIATVSLIVGGIGIMNIMLLSVTERTREIGIRRAVGARAQDVLMQFLLESITLSVVGGLLGIAIGYGVSLFISKVLQWSTQISPLSVALSFGVSAAVGIFFGYYPAKQASQVLPIASLKYE